MNKLSIEEAALGEWFAGACAELGVDCIPNFCVGNTRWPVYLPKFGGLNGMVVGSLNCNYAKPGLFYCSLVNPASYVGSAREILRETLNDWGWFGSVEDRPTWYSGAVWGAIAQPHNPADALRLR